MKRYPPFAPLVAFDAVARHRSFSRAGAELGLTQSAVSHRVRQLETWYGEALFRRTNPGVHLTTAGEALCRRVAGLLQELADLTPLGGTKPIRLAAGTALSTWWLARRLPYYAASNPAARVRLVPCDSAEALRTVAADLRILWVGEDDAAGRDDQRVLFRETVFPVCHPSLLPRGRPLAAPGQLAALPLLHKGDPEQQGMEWNWPSWIGAAGVPPRGCLHFDELGSALAAAAGRAGVALGRSLLVGDAIAEGRLARALPQRFDRRSSKVHVVQWQARRSKDRALRKLVDWLQVTAQRSITADVTAQAG